MEKIRFSIESMDDEILLLEEFKVSSISKEVLVVMLEVLTEQSERFRFIFLKYICF